MSRISRIATPGAAPPGGHYSQGVLANGLLHVSGQLPIPPEGRSAMDASAPFERQAELALANVLAVVAAAGGEPADVLKVNVYVAGVEHWPAFDAVFAKAFGDARPARAVIPVPELHYGFLVEVDAVAFIDPQQGGAP